jgi:hypothetical protein
MMNHNRTRISALALSAALTVAAAIGLTSASEHQAPPRATLQSHCGVTPTDRGLPSILPGVPNDDPELMRVDRSNDHHG